LDACWRPQAYVSNRLERLGEVCLMDSATGLVWQRSGSLDLLDGSRAQDYIDHLNTLKLGGFTEWRLPTVDELISLLKPVPRGSDFCTASMFDRRQKWLWSCDRKSFRASWYVNMEMGYVDWQDDTCYFYVRAVRSAE
jgi:serine/threonine-protein kinase